MRVYPAITRTYPVIPRTYPVIIHVKEHHGSLFYIANDVDDVYNIAFNILQTRNSEEYYSFDAELPRQPSISQEQMAQLPVGPTLDAAKDEWEEYQNRLVSYDETLKEQRLFAQALAGDKKVAFSLLQKWQSADEEFIIIQPSYIKDLVTT